MGKVRTVSFACDDSPTRGCSIARERRVISPGPGGWRLRHQGDPELAPYLLELHDELDRLDGGPPGRRVAWACLLLGTLVLLALILSGAPLMVTFEVWLVVALPGGYLMQHARTRRRQREAIQERIDIIERTRRTTSPGMTGPDFDTGREAGTE